MKIDEAVSILRTYNEWRRSPAHYLESVPMPAMGDPRTIGIAIDTVCDALSKSGEWTRALRLADECEESARAWAHESEALREALAALKAENEMLRKALKDADNEMGWLDEDIDTCDHSVGVCTCSYWRMRRNMKAALSKGNGND